MLIIIKTAPYENEDPLGFLYIALSAANSGEKVSVVFVEKGLYCLLRNADEFQSIIGNQESKSTSQDPVSFPEIYHLNNLVLQLVGEVKFFYVPTSNPKFPSIFRTKNQNSFGEVLSKEDLLFGVKKINFKELYEKICDEGQNLLMA